MANDNPIPRRRTWPQFGLARALVAMTCVVVAAATIAVCRQQRFQEPSAFSTYCAMPVSGALLGFGIGLLTRHPWWLSAFGLLVGVAFDFLVGAAIT